jgi:hypothetical protein
VDVVCVVKRTLTHITQRALTAEAKLAASEKECTSERARANTAEVRVHVRDNV